MRDLLKVIAVAGIAHALNVFIANNGGGDAFLIGIPVIQFILAVLVYFLASAGEAFKDSKDKAMAAAVLLAVLPAGFLWNAGVIILFVPASIWALWLVSRGQRDTMWDLSFLGEIGSLNAALFAASTIPGMVGNRLDEDTTSLLAVLLVLMFFATVSILLLLTGSEGHELRSRLSERFSGHS